jgi:hypothetical protein
MSHQVLFMGYGGLSIDPYAWNPSDKDADIVLSTQNRLAEITAALGSVRSTTFRQDDGTRWQYELYQDSPDVAGFTLFGFGNSSATLSNYPGVDSDAIGFYSSGGTTTTLYIGNVAYTINPDRGVTRDDHFSIVWFADASVGLFANGVWIGKYAGTLNGDYAPMWGTGTGGAGTRKGLIYTGSFSYPMLGAYAWNGSYNGAGYSAWNGADKDADVSLLCDAHCAEVVSSGSSIGAVRGVTGRSSGKYQVEFVVNRLSGSSNDHLVGFGKSTATLASYPGSDSDGYGYYSANGFKYNSGSGTSYGAAYGAGDVIGAVYDVSAGTIEFFKNGVSQGTAYSSVSGTLYPMWGPGTLGSGTRNCFLNTGNLSFAYPVSGATAWDA